MLRAGNRFRFFGNDLVEYNAEPGSAWMLRGLGIGARAARERSPSARYVSSEMVGYDDLDAYGNWSTVANYGPVWVPSRVEA